MASPKFETVLNDRKSRFVNFRWLLAFWLAALTYLSIQGHLNATAPAYAIVCFFVVSQFTLQALPTKYFDGIGILNAIFLLDVNFIIAGFWATNQLQPEMMVALFVGIFMAALSRSMAQSFATTAVILGIYIAFKLEQPGGIDFSQPEQLLQLPFLFIASLHSTMLAQEADNDLNARQVLQADKSRLSRHMNNTLSEIAHYCKDMSALVDALPFGAIMLDNEKRIRVCNDIAEEVLGIDSAPLLGATLDVDPSLMRLMPYLDKVDKEPLLDFVSAELPCDDGGSWSLNLGLYPVREGEIERGLLLVLIPTGYAEIIQKAMPKPHMLPKFTKSLPPLPILTSASLAPLPATIPMVGAQA